MDKKSANALFEGIKVLTTSIIGNASEEIMKSISSFSEETKTAFINFITKYLPTKKV